MDQKVFSHLPLFEDIYLFPEEGRELKPFEEAIIEVGHLLGDDRKIILPSRGNYFVAGRTQLEFIVVSNHLNDRTGSLKEPTIISQRSITGYIINKKY